jgi:hypothetical protein
MSEETAKPVNVRVEHHVEATINLGNFQNVKPGYSLSADVPDGLHPSEVAKKLRGLAENWLLEDIENYRKEMEARGV